MSELIVDDVLLADSPLARRLPGYEEREGQLEARAVHRALERDRHVFVEAGTGTGTGNARPSRTSSPRSCRGGRS